MRRISSGILLSVAVLIFASTTGAAPTVYWTDWTSKTTTPPTVSGTITIGSTPVNVVFSGVYSGVQISGGTNYWNWPIYDVPNRPTTYDIIQLNSGDTDATITFSKSVHDPLLALVSWNGNTVDFGVPIEVVSNGRGSYGSGTPIINSAHTGFYGSGEVHGVIRLVGDFTSITFSHTSEGWHGFTVGVTELTPVPLPGALWLLGPGLVGLAAIRRRFRR